MSTDRETPRVGELRPSQLLTTFGVGAIIDLDAHDLSQPGSVIIQNRPGRDIDERIAICDPVDLTCPGAGIGQGTAGPEGALFGDKDPFD